MTVHNPYRPLEGLLIVVKVCDKCRKFAAPRRKVYSQSLFTDAVLLAAVFYAVDKAKVDMAKDSIQVFQLFAASNDSGHAVICDKFVHGIYQIVGRSDKKASKEEIQRFENKLKQCQNAENRPAQQRIQTSWSRTTLNPLCFDYHLTGLFEFNRLADWLILSHITMSL
jgi:hypothetical protein